jgi:hypothetical protein
MQSPGFNYEYLKGKKKCREGFSQWDRDEGWKIQAGDFSGSIVERGVREHAQALFRGDKSRSIEAEGGPPCTLLLG